MMISSMARKMMLGVASVAMCLAIGAASAADVIKIKIAYGNNVGEPTDKAVREWGRLVKERSGGRLEFQYVPSSQLGSQKDVTEQLTIGSNVNIITISDGGFLMDYVPAFGVTYLPYLYDSREELFKLVDSDLYKDLSRQLEAKGLYIVANKWIYGIRNMLATKPATKPEELKGLKIRVPNIRLSNAMMNAMGATATPMPLAEAYPALMQGVINGAENPIPVLYGGKMFEGAKYLLLTQHQINMLSWVGSASFMKKLPPDFLQILKDTADEASKFIDRENEIADKAAIEKMKAAGVTVVEVDRAAFKAALKDFPSRYFNKEFPPEVMDKVYAAIGHK